MNLDYALTFNTGFKTYYRDKRGAPAQGKKDLN